MRIYLVCISVLLLHEIGFSQDNYLEYYQLVTKAEGYKIAGKNDSALLSYEKAFEKVSYVHVRNLFAAKQLAKKLKQKDKAEMYHERIKANRKGINKTYKKIIDSLSKEDQRIRGKKYVNAQQVYYKTLKDSSADKTLKEFLSAQLLMQEWRKVDSANIVVMKRLIALYGYPSEKRVGNAELSALVILLHYDVDSTNEIMKPVLDSALIQGDIWPQHYAWIIDRRMMWGQGKLPYYYEFSKKGIEKLSATEMEEVNRRRRLIGLGDLKFN